VKAKLADSRPERFPLRHGEVDGDVTLLPGRNLKGNAGDREAGTIGLNATDRHRLGGLIPKADSRLQAGSARKLA
jgi:hypothetical protein